MDEHAYLVLGCFGRTENDFVLCPSVENRILKLDDTIEDFHKLVEYLECVHLFDRPLLEQSSVKHLVYNIQNKFDQKFRRLWTDHQFNLLERFMVMHKPCGYFAKLILVPEEIDIKEPEQISFIIKGTPEIKYKEPTFQRNKIR